MRHSVVTLGLAIATASLVGCAGAADDVEDDDLPESYESVSEALTAEADPAHVESGDHERDCKEHDGKKKGKRLHHLFKRLDRLDGDKDHRIVIASLPTRVRDRVILKLHELDTNDDGVVTKDEVKAARRAHKHHGRDDG